MKKLLLLFIIYFLHQTIAAQFMVTPEGLRSDMNEDIDYQVIYVPNKNENELYLLTYKYLIKNGENIIQSSKYESLTYKVEDDHFILLQSSGGEKSVFANYEVNLKFSDQKILYKIDLLYMPVHKSKYSVIFKGNLRDGFPIYNNKLKIVRDNERKQIEDYFNDKFLSFKQRILRTARMTQSENNTSNNSQIVIDENGLATFK